jgi:hypothetical protein
MTALNRKMAFENIKEQIPTYYDASLLQAYRKYDYIYGTSMDIVFEQQVDK